MPIGNHRASIIIDRNDAGAFNEYMEFRCKGGRVQVKGFAWKRWKDVCLHLTGTMCYFRNGDDHDFRRDNLIPALKPWACERSKYT